MNETLTVADVVRMRPCGLNGEDNGTNYTRHRIKALWAGRERLTLLDVLELDIPIEDRLWCVLRAVDPRTRAILACDFAGHVLPLFEAEHPDDRRPRAVLETLQRWLDREATDEELDAARAAGATRAAACAVEDAARAARVAARAAWAAAGATRAAACAVEDAAWAARVAAGAAAGVAERDWQLARTREVLEELAEEDDDE